MIDLKPLPMEEARQFWRDKVPLSPGQFNRLSDEARVRAFAVSGIARGGELSTVMAAIQKSIDAGTTFDDFRKTCASVFERRGWTGWRTETIFRTNIQTAYGVGRYRQMMDVRESRPYWQYSAVNDSQTRPSHAALNGRVFPADHPFWNTWYPPNGFNCRCGVVTLSAHEVERDGLKVERDDPTGKLIEPVDPMTGNRMPARPLMPDIGFDHNPGKTVWGGIVDAAKQSGTWESLPGLRAASDYRLKALANVSPDEIADFGAEMLLPSGKSNDFYKAEFIRRFGEEKVIRDVLGEPAVLSLRTFLIDKTPGAAPVYKFDKSGHGASILMMEDILLSPYEVWLAPQKNEAGRVRLVKRYLGFWKTEDRARIGGLGVYEVADGVFQGVTNFVPLKKNMDIPNIRYLEGQRQGLLLYRRGGGRSGSRTGGS